MKKMTKPERIADLCILILFLISLLWVFAAPTRQELSVEMYYRSAGESILSQLFWGENGELSALNCSDGNREGNVVLFDLPQSPVQLQMLRIDPSNTEEIYSITRIAFLLNGEYFRTMSAQEIAEKFIPVNATLSVSGEELIVTPQNTDSGLLIDSAELNESALEASRLLHADQVRQRFFAMLFLSAALMLLVHFAVPIAQYLRSLFTRDASGRFDCFTLTATAVMAGALLVVTVIGLLSELGLHPDEWDVKACLDYGMTHFLPPDMRALDVSGTYSGYGYTKLENYTWYFFLAGKIALLFKAMFYSIQYYRIPNILLFAALSVIFVRNIKKKNWLMVALGICVQVWYIFSYTTADALDFFWSFLAVYELSEENSLLYRTIKAEKITRKNFPGFCVLGLLYGMIALGKPNYLAILALTFFVLVFKLAREKDKCRRGCLWHNYFCIVGIFAAVVFARAGFDLAYYGLEKAEIKETMAIQYSDYDKNPATPLQDQSPSYHMMAKGASLSDFFAENPDWFAMSYKSFCGITPLNDTGSWYYIAMGILYFLILLGIGLSTFRQKNNFWGNAEFVVGILLMIIGLIASVINSYVIDSQAQGRYLLPMTLIAGYLASRVPQFFEKWYCRALLLCAGVLSVAFFGLVGVPMFL